MSPEILSTLAGVVLSLAFSYIPGLNDWYDRQAPNVKRLVMLGMLLVAAIGVFGYACLGPDAPAFAGISTIPSGNDGVSNGVK